MTEEHGQRHPLSFAQERLWFLDQLLPGQVGYLTPLTYRITGELDGAALEAALREVARRHPVLRCRFGSDGGEPYAVVGPADALRLERRDLSGGPEPERAAQESVRTLLGTPLDLAAGPPLRAVLLRLAPAAWLLHVHVHHVAFDGLSRPVFERELSAAYTARLHARPAALPEPPADPFGYIGEERAALRGPERDRLLEHWLGRLADVPTVLSLPSDRPRPAQPTGRGAQLDFTLPAATTEALHRLAAERRASLFAVALAGYQELLGRYAGTRRMLCGVPFAGRTEPGTEEAIGFFTHTVALPGDLRGRPTLGELTERVRDEVWDAMDHQELPFDMLVEALGAARGLDRTPLVQHWFDITDETLAERPLRLDGADVAPVEYPETVTRFDTELHLRPAGEELHGRLLYATDLFDEARMRTFLRHYAQLLGSAARSPDTPLAALPLLDGPEQTAVLRQGTGPAQEAAGAAGTVAALFARRAAEHPTAPAVTDGVTRLTYARLAERAGAVARLLAARGCGPEDVVAVCLPRGAELVCAALGAVLAGSCYLLIDPEQPPERLAYLLDDSGARLVLTDAATRPRLPGADGRPVPGDGAVPPVLDVATAVAEGAATAGTRPAPPGPAPGHLAYLVYTSGSTGRPKAVAVTHAGLAHLTAWHHRRYPVRPGASVVAQVAGVSFDAAAWEIWPALAGGARLEICPDAVVRDPEALVRHLADTGADAAFAPTPLAEQLIRHPLGTRTALTALLTGGDLFRPRPDDAPGIGVHNHYGPTENTVVATATDALGPPWHDNTIGRPIDGVRAYVLDDGLQLVPPGAPGELWLAGAGLARGYAGRPALTAGHFVPDPFAPHPGERMYRTGDLVRRRDDGTLDFLGRRDAQLKVNGYRIEPGEVEQALLRCHGVREAVVTVARSPAGGALLAGYVVPAGQAPTADGLRDELRARLPSPLVPAAFVVLDALPLTASGKVDRARLPAPQETAAAPLAPRGPLEKEVLLLWQEVFPGVPLGVSTDFFTAGGTSMTASRLAARVRESLGVAFPVRAVFDHRTVADQCAEIERQAAAEIAEMTEEEIARELNN
ncbi:non-ribosomal peptide synthetase [Streptomyces cacaoi]|uniref:non-ribosomal peptide synthetase n=1 Tax=Streptomyces cacaoi TaxID=1898 RepID=UPI002638345A|nr:amino acid adenylation domain-containing protein [Streptomyces cacaoi]